VALEWLSYWQVLKGFSGPLDPASYDPAGGSNLVTKMGIGATRKANYPDEISVPGFRSIDMEAFIPGYRSS
jgi:hypothetical protein